MSPDEITARLERCAELSADLDHSVARVDMSPAAVEARLAECAELSALCFDLDSRTIHSLRNRGGS